MRRMLTALVLALFALPMVWSGGQEEAATDEIVLRVRAFEPEYLEQDRQIWDVFEEENPGVSIELIAVNESEEPGYYAKIAAGELPAHLSAREHIGKETYQHYVNLKEIDFPYWDVFTYNADTIFEEYQGVKGYQPYIAATSGPTFTFIFHRDLMERAGIENPEKRVRTLDDLRDLLAELKIFVDSSDDIDYVWTTGWIPRGVMQNWASAVHYAMGHGLDEQRAVFLGEVPFTDLEQNPFVSYFEFFKEMYDKGYFPEKWWLRDWETDFEASFISKKAMLAFHGPWLWDKTLAADGSAKLGGFPMPAAPNGRVWTRPTDPAGSAILKASMDDPNWETIKKAFIWWNSPKTLQMRLTSYAQGNPLVDLSSVGGLQLKTPQYQAVLGPFSQGFWWDWKWDNGLLGELAAQPYRKDGTANPMMDNAVVPLIGNYYEGKISMAELMSSFQKRWEIAYPNLAK